MKNNVIVTRRRSGERDENRLCDLTFQELPSLKRIDKDMSIEDHVVTHFGM